MLFLMMTDYKDDGEEVEEEESGDFEQLETKNWRTLKV